MRFSIPSCWRINYTYILLSYFAKLFEITLFIVRITTQEMKICRAHVYHLTQKLNHSH